MALNPDQHRLSESELRIIFERDIANDIFRNARPCDSPVAVIFGGQPGSGKSAAVSTVAGEFSNRGGLAQIIGDELRDYHPRYDKLLQQDDKTAAFFTDRDTARWVELAIEEAKQRRVNIVIEGTMRDHNKVAQTMLDLRKDGYFIDARALAVNYRFSEQGILQRYEGQKADHGYGRMTTSEAHQRGYEGMPVTLERIEKEKLADRVSIYRRGAQLIYSNELRGDQWTNTPRARETTEAERTRPMTIEERVAYFEGYEKLSKQVEKTERAATASELQHINTLQTRAKRELYAAVFLNLPAEAGKKMIPDLAQAYGAQESIEKRLNSALGRGLSLTNEQKRQVLDNTKVSIASSIERGRSLTSPTQKWVKSKEDRER